MIGNKSTLLNLHPINSDIVIFCDSDKWKVLVIGTLKVHGMLILEDILLVEDLKINFIRISQL